MDGNDDADIPASGSPKSEGTADALPGPGDDTVMPAAAIEAAMADASMPMGEMPSSSLSSSLTLLLLLSLLLALSTCDLRRMAAIDAFCLSMVSCRAWREKEMY